MFRLKANNQGQDLISHSLAVSRVSKYLAEKLGLSNKLIDASEKAGLLHDVGKAERGFQCYMSGNVGKGQFDGPYHHEVSWAVLRSGGFNDQIVLNAVYWHHAQPLTNKYEVRERAEDILDGLELSDVFAFCESVGIVLDTSLPDKDVAVPTIYHKKHEGSTNAEMMGVRACVVAADRFVSTLVSDLSNIDMAGLDKYFGDVGTSIYTMPTGYDATRFVNQVECVTKCLTAQTSQVRAPAGYGKTMQGILYSLERGRRAYWVTPRNVIAESIYVNIQRELKALGVSRSVELFLGGIRKECTNPSIAEGFSDIVVTNIDNLLKPMVSNDFADKLYLSLVSDVVFDEYHEFVNGSPMFAAFVHLMRLRHQLTDVPRTLLLSATPMCLSDLWDIQGRETLILPSRDSHYPAAHSKSYEVSFIHTYPQNTMPGGVTIMNSIRSAQEIKIEQDTDVVAHSKFTPSNRKLLMNFLISKFGKGGDGVSTGVRVASAPILQAALDISFTWMQESVLSPEATLQRLGRLDRWGDYDGICKLVLLDLNDNKESGATRAIYDLSLRRLWLTMLESEFKTPKTVTLQDMYTLYAKFYTAHSKDVRNWFNTLLKDGTKQLAECGPVKIPNMDKKDGVSSGKSLRTPGGSFFYIMKDSHGQWLPPGNEFSWQFRDLRDALDKTPRTKSNWAKLIKEVLGQGYTGFTRMSRDIKRMKKSLDATATRWTKKLETPYPVKTLVYSGNPNATCISELGIGVEGDESLDD